MAPQIFRAWIPLIFLSFALALTACASVRLVPAYDEQIDVGLTSLYGDTTAFVDKMTALAGTPEGDFAHNREFYDDAFSRVEALSARAEAHRVLNDCPSSKVVEKALSSSRIPAEVRGTIGTLPKDDCQVVLMRLIRTGFDQMKEFHEAQGDRGIPPSARGPLLEGGVGALLRAGITVEIAKRAQ